MFSFSPRNATCISHMSNDYRVFSIVFGVSPLNATCTKNRILSTITWIIIAISIMKIEYFTQLTLFPIVRKSGKSFFRNFLPFPREHLFQTALFEPFQFLDFAPLQFDGLVLRGENFGNLLLLCNERK